MIFKKQSNIGSNRKSTSFKTTERMSTYLVGWVIVPDDFGYVEYKSSNGIPVILLKKIISNKFI